MPEGLSVCVALSYRVWDTQVGAKVMGDHLYLYIDKHQDCVSKCGALPTTRSRTGDKKDGLALPRLSTARSRTGDKKDGLALPRLSTARSRTGDKKQGLALPRLSTARSRVGYK
jgi:hypothetical protein